MTYKNPIPNAELISQTNSAEIGRCEFCDKDNKIVRGTSVTGCYCKECLNLAISECKRAIKDIEEFKKSKSSRVSTKTKITTEDLAELEKEKDVALEKLLSGDFTKL